MRLTCAIPAAVMLMSSFVAALDSAEFASASIQALERPNVAFHKKKQDGGYYLGEDFEEDFEDKFEYKHDKEPDIVFINQETKTVTAQAESVTIIVPGEEVTVTVLGEPVTVTVPGEPVTVTVPGEPVTVQQTVSVTVTSPPSPIPSCFLADSRTPVQERGTPFSYSDCAAICRRGGLPIAGLQYRVRKNSNNLYACFCYPNNASLPQTPSDRCHLFQESSNPNYLYYYGETVEEVYLFPATLGDVPNGITAPIVP